MTPADAHLEVWGDPIAHSRSPALHTAAYRMLGLGWTYGRRRVDEAGFRHAFADAMSTGIRGLSLTMPLKSVAFAAADERDRTAETTGAVNTLLLAHGCVRGFNTDVGGIVRALDEAGVTKVSHARIVGAGATATSALVALGDLGATRVDIAARRPDAAARLCALGDELGIAVTATALGAADDVEVTIATLPGEAPVDEAVAARLAQRGGLLLDVVYGRGPTALSQSWMARGQTALSGEGMLLHQAVLQVRVFTTGRVDEPLPDETAVAAAMRSALVGD